MDLSLARIGLGFLAGMVSLLSPCVLPLLPLVLGAATAGSRSGLFALAAGLILSFVGVGLFVAMIGFSIGLDGGVFRAVSATLLGGFGVVLLSGALHRRFAIAAGSLANAGDALMRRISPDGPAGQFLLGLLLGAVWAPCVGPTLGAASLLAAQGRDLTGVIPVMVAFGLGTAIPMVLIGLLSQEALMVWRGRLSRTGRVGERILGIGALAVAALVLTGLDHSLETVLLAASPAWLTRLTVRF